MKINTLNRRHVIQATTAGLSTRFVVPFAGVHRATTLTITTGNRSVSLNGRQVRALREVLSKSTQLPRKAAKPAKPAKPTKPVKKGSSTR